MHFKKVIILLLVVLVSGCAKDNKTFSLKAVQLNEFNEDDVPPQNLFIKIIDGTPHEIIAQTGIHPSAYSLPAKFSIQPAIPMMLYSQPYSLELWGDVSGYLASCDVHMEAYKIIFPIDMEVENDSLSISMAGSWK